MVFVGWGLNGLIFLFCVLLVVYDEQAGVIIERFAPWLDLRTAGVLAISASVISISVRLYMMVNPPDTVVIYWNLIYFAVTILAAVLLVSVAPDVTATFRVDVGGIGGDGQGAIGGSQYDPSLAALGLIAFLAFCVFRIEMIRAQELR